MSCKEYKNRWDMPLVNGPVLHVINEPYTVKFTKEFVSGNLNGIMLDASIDFNSLESANDYINFLHAHKTVPVISLDSSNYICHLARIERE